MEIEVIKSISLFAIIAIGLIAILTLTLMWLLLAKNEKDYKKMLHLQEIELLRMRELYFEMLNEEEQNEIVGRNKRDDA